MSLNSVLIGHKGSVFKCYESQKSKYKKKQKTAVLWVTANLKHI